MAVHKNDDKRVYHIIKRDISSWCRKKLLTSQNTQNPMSESQAKN